MKYLYSLMALCIFLLGSCNEITTNQKPKTIKNDETAVIIHEEFSGTEPTKPEETEYYEPKVPVVGSALNGKVPNDATILFDGTSFDDWVHSQDSSRVKWHLNKDGSMTVADKTGNIQTKENFGDLQLHLEWRSPAEIQREGQNRGNSGVYFDGLYEVQILDNNDNDTYVNGQVASIYKQYVPQAMASVASGEWNSYDIIYHAPKFNNEGGKVKSGTITVLHNGVLVHDHVDLKGTTEYIGWPKNEAHGKGPIMLQDHGDNSRVSYRNIWVRNL